MRLLTIAFWLFLVSGCASYGVIDNRPISEGGSADSYAILTADRRRGTNDISLMLAFSGGGTRAAALAYGVLQELRDTEVTIDGQRRRLLDEIDLISSVSGGSFTAAYYGLYGDRIFDDFESVFLRRDVEGQLIRGLLNPTEWFSQTGRTEMAVKFYEEAVFHGATFADMKRAGGPLVLINASDLGYGVRFSFTQEYFNLLCSDIASFPVARAVTASSAVPVLFNPVVVRNYPDCKQGEPAWLVAAEQRARHDPDMREVVHGLKSYFETDRRTYAHLVDGGITDNLGLRAIYEVTEIVGGPIALLQKRRREAPRRVVLMSVNASTDPEPAMDASNKQPSLMETVNAMSDVQLHRYNAATLQLMRQTVTEWARELSTPQRPVTPYLMELSFRDIHQPERRRFFNRVPTSFALSEEQVDRLIEAGREILRNDPAFQRLVADLRML
jgi:NTE family protein